MATPVRARTTGINQPKLVVHLLIAFFVGCALTTTVLLHFVQIQTDANRLDHPLSPARAADQSSVHVLSHPNGISSPSTTGVTPTLSNTTNNSLNGIRILIAIAAYDFSQLPHLEEVLDGYQDLCTTGAARVDIVLHATIPYPVALIDLWNSRLLSGCKDVFSLQITLVPSVLRLHLVDCHRPLFYEKINEYDLFIYTEDDIRVTPRTVAGYLDETRRLRDRFGPEKASLMNVGIVRYEYNFPSNVVMDDKTRHATQNVTRVYWEHGQFPILGKAVEAVPIDELSKTHVHMKNHHQGMFLATRELLLAWKEKPGCEFDKVRNRPGMKNRPSQPSEGTQRVWMSSQMLYGKHHCGIQQVIPIAEFGTLTVLHLPNKNYRRVGHYQNRTFSDGTEKFDFGATGSLLTAMELHLELRRKFPPSPKHPYWGVTMVDQVDMARTSLLKRRMGEYHAYVDRGGILSEKDFSSTALVEEQ